MAFAWIIVITLLSPSMVNSLYFHMRYLEEKCFYLELPGGTNVIGNFSLETWNMTEAEFKRNVPEEGLQVKVLNFDKKVIISKVYGTKGRFAFTSETVPSGSGDHVVCLSSNNTGNRGWGRKSPFGDVRIHLEMHSGGHAVDYDLVARKEKLTSIQLKIRQLLDHLDQIKKEQEYQREREQRFRQTSDSTNNRVFFFVILQTIIIFVSGLWQLVHLKKFFVQKKMV